MRGNATAHRDKGGERRDQKTGSGPASTRETLCEGALLLPGALLVAIGAQLLAPFVLIDFGFPAFF